MISPSLCYSCSAEAPLSQLKMYSFMGGGLFCAIVGNILLVISTATDYWMQYRLSGNYAHQGLWRYCISNKCYMQTDSIGKDIQDVFQKLQYQSPCIFEHQLMKEASGTICCSILWV